MVLSEPPNDAESNDTESLERFFERFAQVILVQMSAWATSDGIPQSIHQVVVEQFARKQWSALQTSSTEEPLSSEEIKSLLYRDFLFPLVDLLEHYDTFQPTREQLQESYIRYHEMWTASLIRWDVTIPL